MTQNASIPNLNKKQSSKSITDFHMKQSSQTAIPYESRQQFSDKLDQETEF